jgi:hypothetical protein
MQFVPERFEREKHLFECGFCRKTFNNWLEHLSYEKECEISKLFRRWVIFLFKEIRILKENLLGYLPQMMKIEENAIPYQKELQKLYKLETEFRGRLTNKRDYLRWIDLSSKIKKIRKNIRELEKRLIEIYDEPINKQINYLVSEMLNFFQRISSEKYSDILIILSQLRNDENFNNFFFRILEEFLCVEYNKGSKGVHKAKAYLGENGLFEEVEIFHRRVSSLSTASIFPSCRIAGVCKVCKSGLVLTIDIDSFEKKVLIFREEKKIDLSKIEFSEKETIRNILEKFPRPFSDFLFLYLLQKITNLKEKLDTPVKDLKDNEKSFFYFFLNLVRDLYQKDFEDLIEILRNRNFILISCLEDPNYNNCLENLLLFFILGIKSIKDSKLETFLKTLESFQTEIRNIYICPFCSRIYLLLTNNKYIVFGEDYLEIGVFYENEIKQCFKKSTNHYVVRIYPEELS